MNLEDIAQADITEVIIHPQGSYDQTSTFVNGSQVNVVTAKVVFPFASDCGQVLLIAAASSDPQKRVGKVFEFSQSVIEDGKLILRK